MLVKNNKKGFTLIELLVVISIISLLSSIIFASLQSARLKGQDSAIISEMLQYRTLLELEYNNTNSYLALQPNTWFTSLADCTTAFPLSGAPNVIKANQICQSMYTLSAQDPYANPGWRLCIGNGSDQNNKYSLMVYLPGKKTWQCLGISGQSAGISFSGWNPGPGPLGCYYNP